MDSDSTTMVLFAIARFIHIGASLLLLSICAFDRLIIASVAMRKGHIADAWSKIAWRGLWIAWPAALISGAAWFAVVTAAMSGLPLRDALSVETLKTVWSETQFGLLWQLRLVWLVVATIFMFANHGLRLRSRARTVTAWLAVACNCALVGSLAWSGHGQTGRFTQLHLGADVIHLLAAALWPVGLLPFCSLLLALRRNHDPAKWPAVAIITRRFSAISLTSVAVLTGTGLVNTCCLIGSPGELFSSTYGRLLILKVFLFLVMVSFGSINLLRLKPELLAKSAAVPDECEMLGCHLQRNVAVELVLGTIVVLVVAIIGLLPPGSGMN